jgi:hypothetical protein
VTALVYEILDGLHDHDRVVKVDVMTDVHGVDVRGAGRKDRQFVL